MAAQTSRRGFLRADFNEEIVMRPLGAVEERSFQALCDGCSICADVCPEKIIEIDSKNKARVSFENGACTFCGDCTDACPTGALTQEAREKWDWVADVTSSCLSLNRISCRTCEDFCDHNAIRFQLQTGGRAQPVINEANCTGCGACASACPADAVVYKRQNNTNMEATG